LGSGGAGKRVAEFVQVKASKLNSLWSVASLCAGKNGKPGTSIFEISLARDKHFEEARFRLVTLRPVVSGLEMLTLPRGAPGRERDGERFKKLESELNKRFPELKSQKGNGTAYWLENCFWDYRESEAAVQNENLVRLIRLSCKEGQPLLIEFAEATLEELRARAKEAGQARWEPDRHKKIIAREALHEWWERRIRATAEGAATPSGGNLREKMIEAGLSSDIVELAVEMRRDYAVSARTSRYMESGEAELLQSRVKSEVMSLRARLIAGKLDIDIDGAGFHALCLDRMDAVNAERPKGSEDRSAFLKGCMYDIADRCLLRFTRSAR
jgi:Cap4 dsDNA endonuclease